MAEVLGVRYRVHSAIIDSKRWYPTKAEAIAAFERQSKRAGVWPPERYPPGVSGDSTSLTRARPVLPVGAMVIAGSTLTLAMIDRYGQKTG